MKIQKLSSRFASSVRFELSAALRVPTESGCYALANVYDDVLYIGLSEDLHRRFEQHLSNPRMTGLTSLGLAHSFYYFYVPVTDLKTTEDQLLSRYKFNEGQLPPLNRAGP